MDRIDPLILDAPVRGVNLTGSTFGEQLAGDGQTLLVFLRHSGCMFCREMVTDLRGVSAAVAGYPPVVFVFQGGPDDGREFFDKYWPDARGVADLPRQFYDAFGIRRATFGRIAGLPVWGCAARALIKGHTNTLGPVVPGGRFLGDPWLMPGAFLVRPDGAIDWSHRFGHVADHPDWPEIPFAARVNAR